MTKLAYFAAGCFWGVEDAFMKMLGVVGTEVGYMGGTKENPTYEDVLTHTTGHAETVKIEFDPEKISYSELLNKFWEIHDPTQVNRQGPDIGDNYRSAIFYADEEQKRMAEGSKRDQEESKKFSRPIATEISPVKKFWKAEDYHQHYFQKTGRTSCPI
jgi:peptide-methionine (S)-S-oxide reductase